MTITFPCGKCGQRYQVDEHLAGKRIPCKKCGEILSVPVPRQSSPTMLEPTARKPRLSFDDPPRPRQKPEPADDPFGLGASGETDPFSPADDPGDFLSRRGHPGYRGKKASSSFRLSEIGMAWKLGVGLSVLGVAAVMVLFPTGRLVLGVVLLLVSFALAMGGGVWGLVTAFQEDVVCGILYLVLPFYSLYYTISRWEEMRKPFATALLGMVLFVPGILLTVSGTSVFQDAQVQLADVKKHSEEVQRLGKKYGFNKLVTIRVDGVDDDETRKEVERKISSLATASRAEWSAERLGDTLEVAMAPVDEPEPFARKIKFGSVESVFGRTINVDLEEQAKVVAVQPPPFQAPPVQAPPVQPPPAVPQAVPFLKPEVGSLPGAERGPAEAPDDWSVQVDPTAEPVDLSGAKDVKIVVPPSFFGGEVTFATTPSAFVAVGRNGDDNDVREVWDLRASKRAGRLRGKFPIDKPFALHPDGDLFLAKAQGQNGVAICSFKKGKLVGGIGLPSPFFDYFDFAGKGRVLTSTTGDKTFQLWDLQSGQGVREIKVPVRIDKESLALSPGRRYLAVFSPEDNRLRVYELESGNLAGETIAPKPGNFGLNCKGMTFSPDGAQLAAVFESFGKVSILCWDVATGKLDDEHQFDEKSGLKVPFGFEGRAIEWLPDKSAWIVFHDAVIDRQSGQRVFTLPWDNEDARKQPIRMLDQNRGVFVAGSGQNKMVRSFTLPKDKIANATQVVRSGGSAADAQLPPLKAADWSGVKQVEISAAPGDWSVPIDPLPKSRKPIGARPMNLKVKNNEVQRILFSGPEAGAVAVSSVAGGLNALDPNATSGNPRRIDRHDLATGRALGSLEFPTVSELAAFSPDGTRVMLVDSKDHHRLDVISIEDKKNVLNWRPYDKEEGDDKAILWAAFLDKDRVLTVNKAGTLVLWSLTDARAIYAAEGACLGAPALSPGRKSLATYLNGTVRLLDPETGSVQGEAVAPSGGSGGRPDLKALVFRPDGEALAAIINANTLVVWDLKTGQVRTEFPSPIGVPNPNTPLEFAGTNFLLVDNRSLIDVDRKWHVWSYFGGPNATGSPDVRHWFVSATFNQPCALVAVTLPEKRLAQIEEMAADPSVPALIRSGATISLQLEFNGPARDNQQFRAKAVQELTTNLQRVGVKVADGPPVRLVVKVAEKDTGATLELRKMFHQMGENPFARQSIPIRNLEAEATLVDPSGPVPLGPKEIFGMGGHGIIHLPAGEKDVEGYLKTQQWNSVQNWIGRLGVPYFVARRPEGVVVLPGVSNLDQIGR